MAKYVADKTAHSAEPLPIIAQNARTGIPVRQTIDPKGFASEPS
jgi:hypothetical protein